MKNLIFCLTLLFSIKAYSHSTAKEQDGITKGCHYHGKRKKNYHCHAPSKYAGETFKNRAEARRWIRNQERGSQRKDKRLTKWVETKRKSDKRYKKSIPKEVMKSLKGKYFSFRPVALVDYKATNGDFNCDGKRDYAITGFVDNAKKRRNVLQIINGLEPSDSDTLDQLKEDFRKISFDEKANILVGLSKSQGDGYNWVKLDGTYTKVRIGSGCRSEKAKANLKIMRKYGCKLLYVSCCERDGEYYNWKPDSTELRFDDGC